MPENKLRTSNAVLTLLAAALSIGCEKISPSVPNLPQDAENKYPAEVQITPAQTAESPWPRPRSKERIDEREQMVAHLVNLYNFHDPEVENALANVPRHWFVPSYQRARAYGDSPLPIGHNQTISQPYIVALMTSLLELDETKKVLEIGTGSGYQAAVLNELTRHVYTIEIIKPLAEATIKKMKSAGYETISFRIGDGYRGWPEAQPFDSIVVTAAPDHIPPKLLAQLAAGGKMVIPVGSVFGTQELLLISKDAEGKISKRSIIPVRFVPMLRE
ncbi:MAG: protein-L-isoaspartate(D-aspartate) O-methyltransferase [Planctomycetota bacterium]|jgi:protein-L-isoaspartate(D-aspartate) O-methyltransferase